MNRKRTVFLFGAGAVIDWGGPKTEDLTKLMIRTGFYCKGNNKRISEKIFEILSGYFPENEINFETILNVIEELIGFYSSKNYKEPNSIFYPFFKSKATLDNIFNFEVNGEIRHGYSLNISGFKQASNNSALNNEHPYQFFLQLLYIELLSGIIAHVSRYSYYTYSNPNIIESYEKQNLNHQFYQWVLNKVGENGIARMYTLNYDRLFSVILKNRGITVFEGAECEASLNPGDRIPFDLQKIVSDFDSHTYYNLHGSAYWDVETQNRHLLPCIQYFMTGDPEFSVNLLEQPIVQLEKGKTLISTKIIAGYQKTQKTAISPFRQMLSAFDRDCLCADNIIIIGYSFGDEHLNESIKMALIHNPKTQIEIIDPDFIKNKLDEKLESKIFSNSKRILSPRNISKNELSFLEDTVRVKQITFKEALKKSN